MSAATTLLPGRATIADLERVEGKAELVDGRIIHLAPTGFEPGRVAMNIAVSLHEYRQKTGRGFALGDNVGFRVPQLRSGRESFSPDTSYYDGPVPKSRMKFVDGPPTFAVEVRSEGDYGPAAELAMAAKRADYFEAGTLVVWDVDTVNEKIHVFRSGATASVTFERGQEADAEPGVAGWKLAVNRVFG